MQMARYPLEMELGPVTSDWDLLWERLGDLEEHADQLGEDPPTPGAFFQIRLLVERAQAIGLDPSALRIHPDSGSVGLSHYGEGETVTASADGSGPICLFFSKLGQRTTFIEALTQDSALSALYAPVPAG